MSELSLSGAAARQVAPSRGARAVLRLPAFRRLAAAVALSGLGDWLALLALTAFAAALAAGSYAQSGAAIAGVFVLGLAPAVVLGRTSAAVTDRVDRRVAMLVSAALRSGLVLSVPLVGRLWWLYVATFLAACASPFWAAATAATVPRLVPRDRVDGATRARRVAAYGAAPLAAATFALLTVAGGPLRRVGIDAVELALVVAALTFLAAALAVGTLPAVRRQRSPTVRGRAPSLRALVVDGPRVLGATPGVRGVFAGMLAVVAAAGAVVAVARIHVPDLGAGNPGYGVLLACLLSGAAVGRATAPRLLPGFSRRRLFGLAVAAAGVSLALLAVLPDLVLAALGGFVLGTAAGVAWSTGCALLELAASDELRRRTVALAPGAALLVLLGVLAVAPLGAAAVGRHLVAVGSWEQAYGGSTAVWVVVGLFTALLGARSYRVLDDRRGTPLRADVVAALRRGPAAPAEPREGGFFLAVEGGEGAGKSTQLRLLADRLADLGHEVVVTREPGGTEVGSRLREILLDPASSGLPARAEALLYAADRADHVERIIRPAVDRGAVVLTDRYADSSVAYQGAGRALAADDVAALSRWATEGLLPDLTVVLDVPPQVGLRRVSTGAAAPDRLEREPVDFHERVRAGFLALARSAPERYLVVDATRPPAEVVSAVLGRLEPVLPPTATELAAAASQRVAEEAAAREARRQAEQQRQARVARARAQADARRETEAAARAAAAAAEQERLAERRRRTEEERARRTAAKERRAAERQAAAQAGKRERAEREEARRQQRIAAEEERRTAEAAARQHEEEEEARRQAAADQEAWRRAAEDEARRGAAEEEARRQHVEGEARRAAAVERDRREADREAEARAAQEAAERRRSEEARRPGDDDGTAEHADSPTRQLSLADDPFSLARDDTVELPRVTRTPPREDR